MVPNILLNEGPRGNFYTDQFSSSSTGVFLNFSKTGGFLSNNGVLATGPNLIIDKDPLNSESIIDLFCTFNNSSATGTVLFKYFVDDIEEATNEVPLQNMNEQFDINEIIAFDQYDKLSIQSSLTGSTESFTGYIECKINSPLISGNFKTSPTGLPTGPIYTPLSFGNPIGIFVGITGPTGSAGFTTIKFTGDSIINVGVEYNVVSSQTGYFQMALAIGNTGIFESEILTSGTDSNDFNDFNYRVNVKNGDVLSVLFRQPTNITGTTQNMTGSFNYYINSLPIKLENGITGFSGLLNFNLSAGGGDGGGSVLGGDGGNGVTIPILKRFLDANPNLLDEILELTPQTITSLIDSGSSMLEGAGVNLDIIDLIQIILLQGGLPGNNNFGNFKYLANTFNFISPISFNGGNGGGIVDAGAGGSGNKNFLGGGGFGGGYGGNILSKNGTSTNIYGSGGGGGSSNNGNGGDGANGSISLLITKIQ